jgi:hypothetical protein
MQLKTVKTTADLPFKGIELVKTDSNITGVIIGGKVRIESNGYGGMKVLVETEGERVERYRVTATLEGFPPAVEHFEYDFQADSAASEFERKGAKVERAKVAVLINEAGKITDAPANDTPVSVADEIPF